MICIVEDVGTLCMYGSLLVYDPLLVLHTTLSMYSTTSSLSVAYNLGAMSGVMLSVQVISGIIIAMSYVASEVDAFMVLDTLPYMCSSIAYTSLHRFTTTMM